ncbi:MAG: MmgE/PrpD family protein [candidate division NC10 bacterium]|nr:MmgE/PrpD family protein [candidate division NC10 bacterium]
MSATGELVSFVRRLDPAGLSDQVLHQASRCVLDVVGVAIAGTRTPMTQISARFASEQFGAGKATVIGSRRPLSVAGAAWVNGNAASALDLDDGHRLAMGHPGAVVIPAALGIAEVTGVRGREFLAAIVAGYEVAVRASVARVPWYKDRMYSSGIWGIFGAAAAAGKLLGFDEASLQSAIGNAASHGPFPPGGLQANYSMVKEVIGWAGMTGCAAALLAQQGFIGPEDVMDYSGRWNPAQLVEGLGDPDRYAILDTYFKPYAVCRWAHSSVDAVLELAGRHGLGPEEIEKILVETFYEVTRLVNYAPRNAIAAQFSIPFALAVALRHGRIEPEDVSEENLLRPEILDLARKVEVFVDPEINSQFPAKTIARVAMQTTRGRFQTTVEYPRGNPENPLSDEELAAKFRSLTAKIVGDRASEKLQAAILGLPRARDVTSLTQLLAF